MALPVMLVLFGGVSQVLISGQSRVHLEQAAYAAARSALVYKCPPMQTMLAVWSPQTVVQTECFRNRQRLDAIAQQRAEDAARWALIAASPTTGAAAARGCTIPESGLELMTTGNRIGGRDTAVRNALCYAFEPGNVTVDLEWQTQFVDRRAGSTRVPIRATVTFRYPLSTPFRRFVGTGERGDGTYWRTGQASVTLL